MFTAAVCHVAPLVRARARGARVHTSVVRAATVSSMPPLATVPPAITNSIDEAIAGADAATSFSPEGRIVDTAGATDTWTSTPKTQSSARAPSPRGSISASSAAVAAAAAAARDGTGDLAGTAEDLAGDPDISKAELLATATAVKLSSYVYKVGALEPWVARHGFVLRAEGVTPCTRWYVCDKVERRSVARSGGVDGGMDVSVSDGGGSRGGCAGGGDAGAKERVGAGETEMVTTQRWVVVRGAAWNNDAVDPMKLSVQIGRAWPSPLHPGVPLVVHTGVAEMASEFWNEVSPHIASLPAGARLCFTGHSLGGSMAILLMVWARLRLGISADRMDPAHTFGTPPVIAVDGWEMHKRGAERTSRRVGAAAAGGADWVGELMGAMGGGGGGIVGGVMRGVLGNESGGGRDGGGVQGDTGLGLLSRPGLDSSARTSTSASAYENPLVLAGLRSDAVRSFVLSNDPVPRMWLAADPLFGAAAANKTVSGLLATREWLFGAGIFSQRRFLYEAVGVLYWLRWSAADGTELSVHRGEGTALAGKLAMAPFWAGESWLTDSPLRALQGSLDHNAQNYVDSVAYVALKRLGHSTSKAL